MDLPSQKSGLGSPKLNRSSDWLRSFDELWSQESWCSNHDRFRRIVPLRSSGKTGNWNVGNRIWQLHSVERHNAYFFIKPVACCNELNNRIYVAYVQLNTARSGWRQLAAWGGCGVFYTWLKSSYSHVESWAVAVTKNTSHKVHDITAYYIRLAAVIWIRPDWGFKDDTKEDVFPTQSYIKGTVSGVDR